jgi:hypothetical protein
LDEFGNALSWTKINSIACSVETAGSLTTGFSSDMGNAVKFESDEGTILIAEDIAQGNIQKKTRFDRKIYN